jgi:hypothetical protein
MPSVSVRLSLNMFCSSLFSFSIDQILEHHHQVDSIRLINGYLGLIKNLIQLVGINITDFLSSSINTQQPLNTSKNLDVNEQHLPLNLRQLLEVNLANKYFFEIKLLFF